MATPKNNQGNFVHPTTRHTIEENAIRLFAEKGYDATSMREIAEASEVTKPVIYYYFTSKEKLCDHLVRTGLDEFHQRLTQVCTDSHDDVFEQMVRAVDVHFQFCKEHPEFTRFIYCLNFGPDKHKLDYDFLSYGAEIFEIMLGLIRRAVHAGIVREGKETAAAVYLRGIINDYAISFLEGLGDFEAGLARTIVSDLITGLGNKGHGAA
ncbi:MAG: TetR/AcrR family transcriptional regulator [Candidatus Abyssubacteria bacterium]